MSIIISFSLYTTKINIYTNEPIFHFPYDSATVVVYEENVLNGGLTP